MTGGVAVYGPILLWLRVVHFGINESDTGVWWILFKIIGRADDQERKGTRKVGFSFIVFRECVFICLKRCTIMLMAAEKALFRFLNGTLFAQNGYCNQNYRLNAQISLISLYIRIGIFRFNLLRLHSFYKWFWCFFLLICNV